jgi:hypothetical protein
MWAQLMSVVLGIWLMAAPAVLGYGGPAATADRIVGPLVASFAAIAVWEATRAVRWANLVLAMWLLLAPLVLGYGARPAVNSLTTAVLLCALAVVRGRARHCFGGGWSALWRPVTPPPRPVRPAG